MGASLNETPTSERLHIGFFGIRNAGKSSLVNAITGQKLSVVSDTPGTTTDPVTKAMEILPLGPVTIIDTPGFDDEGELGTERVKRTEAVLKTCNVAVLVVDATRGLSAVDRELLSLFEKGNLPTIIALSKCDLAQGNDNPASSTAAENTPVRAVIQTSASAGLGLDALKEAIAKVGSAVERDNAKPLISDLINPGDIVVLVIPIDSSAPKGRIILPQQMVMRDALDCHATCVACQPSELAHTLDVLGQGANLSKTCLVITDSQAFSEVAEIVPADIRLTSFSILMARYKGNLDVLLNGARNLDALKDDSRVLIAEGCTHHRQCEDIGTVKIPAWIRKHIGASPTFDFSSGHGFPEDLSSFDLVIHCGGCMLNAKEMAVRMGAAQKQGAPMVNYGIAIAHMKGILPRAIAPLRKGE